MVGGQLVWYEEGKYRERANYFLVSISENANLIVVELDSGEVGDNRVRKPYGWDRIELESCYIV
jgi:hypothetical protein